MFFIILEKPEILIDSAIDLEKSILSIIWSLVFESPSLQKSTQYDDADIDFEKVTFGGSRDSVIYFMSTIIDQYLRYRRSKSYRNRDDDFVF